VVGVYSSGPNAIAATLSDLGSKLGNYTLTQNLGSMHSSNPILSLAIGSC